MATLAAAASGSEDGASAITLSSAVLTSNAVDDFDKPMTWRLSLEVHRKLPEPIEVVFGWMGSAATSKDDVVLDELEAGPLDVGRSVMDLDCDPPRLKSLKQSEIVGNTAVFISLRYRGREFVQVAVLANVSFRTEALEDNPPDVLTASVLSRHLFTKKTHVTRHDISWGDVPAQTQETVPDALPDTSDPSACSEGVKGEDTTVRDSKRSRDTAP